MTENDFRVIQSTVKVYSGLTYENKVIIGLQCFEFIFGHTHGRRNVYSCHIRSNLIQ